MNHKVVPPESSRNLQPPKISSCRGWAFIHHLLDKIKRNQGLNMNYMVGVGTVQHRVFKYNAAAGFLGFGISVSPMSYFFAV